MLTLEICAGSAVSALRAEKGGAHLIELCENLPVGGTTPSIKLLQEVMASAKIRAHVLIRPRAGDFVYSNREIDEMISSIESVKNAGCSGVVIGALDRCGNLDEDAIKTLIMAADGLSLTFHRAIDVAAEPLKQIKKLIDLGFDYVLTSGQQPTAVAGIPMLKTMYEQFGNLIRIIAGGGVNSTNIQHIAMETKILQFHGSARKLASREALLPALQFGITGNQVVPVINEDTDLDEVKRLSGFCSSTNSF
jgi:copper homeostasis protein